MVRSTSAPLEVLVRRADGKAIRVSNNYDAEEAILKAQETFDNDHSITICWVRDKHSNTLRGEVLTRDPPGSDP